MTDSKKTKQAKSTQKRQQVVDAPVQTLKIGSGHDEVISKQDERPKPWAKWTVKPELKYMAAWDHVNTRELPPESAIGQRIAYCRGQLDNLPVEALARYTKYFDLDEEKGVSRNSILRYEAGETLPGARELRILCDALWIPLDWLLYGRIGSDGLEPAERHALDAIRDLFWSYAGKDNLIGLTKSLEADKDKKRIEERQQWIHDARQPKPRE